MHVALSGNFLFLWDIQQQKWSFMAVVIITTKNFIKFEKHYNKVLE